MSSVVMLESLRRHVTNGAFITYGLLVAIIALGVSRFNAPGAAWPSMIWLLAVIAGAGIIGPEFSSGTLQLILVKPINRSVYLLSRVAGVAASVSIVVVVAALCEAAGRALWSGGRGVSFVGFAALNTIVEVLLVCALLALFGSFTRAYFNVAIYLVLSAGLSIGQGIVGMLTMGGPESFITNIIRQYPQINVGIAWLDHNLFPDVPPGQLDRNWLLMVASNAFLALVAACFFFRQREVPYGAD